MSIGSISASTVAASYDTGKPPGDARPAADAPTIADHVAADGERQPPGSASSTLGTLVDTYL
jgi:hypothetical protein